MGKNNLTYEEVKLRKDTSMAKINNLLEKELQKGNIKRVDLISYWLDEYSEYLDKEDKFKPEKMKRYKKGEIVKVNLGFNVGSEEGGLHYAIVMTNKDSLSSPVITVIPLSSKKEGKTIHEFSVDLGTVIYDLVNAKIENIKNILNNFFDSSESITNASDEKMQEFIARMKELDQMNREISKMKSGSYALINQVTTISKMRIYNPKKSSDSLANIRLSGDKLDLINDSFTKFFTKQAKNIDSK